VRLLPVDASRHAKLRVDSLLLRPLELRRAA
jgi:hypothetical protein